MDYRLVRRITKRDPTYKEALSTVKKYKVFRIAVICVKRKKNDFVGYIPLVLNFKNLLGKKCYAYTNVYYFSRLF